MDLQPSHARSPRGGRHAPRIQYGTFEQSWFGFEPFLRKIIAERNVRRICEIGGGANPALPIEFVREHDLDYCVLDMSAAELAKAPAGYSTMVHDILERPTEGLGRFDLVFSKMVAEHMRNAHRFHSNVRLLLRDGGAAFHYFPTLIALPFVANKLLAGAIAERLLHMVQGERERHGRQGKFPAFYQWCRGPVRHQIRRLENLGYVVDDYIGFYGHSYYLRLKPLHRMHAAAARMLTRHPMPSITTYAYVVMSKVPP